MKTNTEFQPLSARMRPTTLRQYLGQAHLCGANKPLFRIAEQKQLHSMILWGPPGTGKTTLARLLAANADLPLQHMSAVFAGIKDIRATLAEAQQLKQQGQALVLFIDEIHRFNKSQQDAFLAHLEEGSLILIGATTENPSFELNNALLSRARVYVLRPLAEADLLTIIEQALTDKERGLGQLSIDFDLALRQQLVQTVDGDARRCLNYLELAVALATTQTDEIVITDDIIAQVVAGTQQRFDKGGDAFYDQLSALHKSVRGSSADAALYWFARLIAGGCPATTIARRVVRMASEDIGNADPRALTIALQAWESYERLGSPEGELVIAQAITYLACAAKSNAVYTAFNAAYDDAKKYGSLNVPPHICNAPTALMKKLGYGKHYRYAHDEAHAYAAGENYFPTDMPKRQYYHPVDRGLEKKIKAKLDYLRQLDSQVTKNKETNR